ncbi:MAG: ATP-binding protein [Thermoanaerobaculales bacterium]
MSVKMEFQRRFFTPPDQSFFLFGPRGTGKSSWIQRTYVNALVVDLLKPAVYREMSARPERLTELVLANPGRGPLVIDEIQRVPELLNVVHDLIERQPGLQFVLTGSSARKLRRGGIDLLAGRALYRTLHPFMAAELSTFSLEAALVEGLLPVVVAAPRPPDVLEAYATLYLEEEVRLEGWTRNVGNFARFLEAVSFSHGAVLNVSNVARDCQIERRTVAGYVEILEDLLLSFRLPVFTRRARRKTSVHPKFYFFDAGVYRSLRPRGPLDRAEEIDGCAFEGLVAQHLRAWIAYSGRDCELYYWRTRAGAEVDFVVYGEGGFWALEVKNTGTVRSNDVRALRSFRDDYPECEAIFVYRGEERLLIDGILCVPGDEFLRSMRPERGLAALG